MLRTESSHAIKTVEYSILCAVMKPNLQWVLQKQVVYFPPKTVTRYPKYKNYLITPMNPHLLLQTTIFFGNTDELIISMQNSMNPVDN